MKVNFTITGTVELDNNPNGLSKETNERLVSGVEQLIQAVVESLPRRNNSQTDATPGHGNG